MNEILAMGGYAVFVWSSVGLGLLVVLWNVIAPIISHKTALRKAGDFHAGTDRQNGENP